MAIQVPDEVEFRAWLEARRNTIVGYAQKGNCCPAANWLTEINGKPISVNGLSVFTPGGPMSMRCPQWLEDFVATVDDDSPKDQPECDGAWCLTVLDYASG